MHKLRIIALTVFLTLSIGIIFAATNNALSNLDIIPNPMEKIATVYVSFAKTASVHVNIETTDGVVVKTIYSGDMSAGNYEFVWNRIGNDGQYVPAGDYFLVVNYNTKYTSTKKTLILK